MITEKDVNELRESLRGMRGVKDLQMCFKK